MYGEPKLAHKPERPHETVKRWPRDVGFTPNAANQSISQMTYGGSRQIKQQRSHPPRNWVRVLLECSWGDEHYVLMWIYEAVPEPLYIPEWVAASESTSIPPCVLYDDVQALVSKELRTNPGEAIRRGYVRI